MRCINWTGPQQRQLSRADVTKVETHDSIYVSSVAEIGEKSLQRGCGEKSSGEKKQLLFTFEGAACFLFLCECIARIQLYIYTDYTCTRRYVYIKVILSWLSLKNCSRVISSIRRTLQQLLVKLKKTCGVFIYFLRHFGARGFTSLEAPRSHGKFCFDI